ncbi:hypothetical protein HYU22_01720 [Candidatus Woesearchaeota archaeon]|nr:hypothetical protein [Candidatus Woesearchaeota archaeon]
MFQPRDKEKLEFLCSGWLTLEMLRWSRDSDLTGEKYIGLLHRYQSSLEKELSSYNVSIEIVRGAVNHVYASLIDLSKGSQGTDKVAYEWDQQKIKGILDQTERELFG